MKKIFLPLAITLYLASLPAGAEEIDRSIELRYCLDLPTDALIAKCAGEVSAGSKKRTFTPQEVEKILSTEKGKAPARTSEPPAALPVTEEQTDTPAATEEQPAEPAPTTGPPAQDVLMKDRGNSHN